MPSNTADQIMQLTPDSWSFGLEGSAPEDLLPRLKYLTLRPLYNFQEKHATFRLFDRGNEIERVSWRISADKISKLKHSKDFSIEKILGHDTDAPLHLVLISILKDHGKMVVSGNFGSTVFLTLYFAGETQITQNIHWKNRYLARSGIFLSGWE